MSAGAPDGVRPLDHTADVGIEVRAPALEALFRLAALGMAALLTGEEERTGDEDAPPAGAGAAARGSERAEPAEERLELDADDAESLLVRWLRELLWLHQDRGALFRDARFEALTGTGLVARLLFEPEPPPALREIKGVTYHGLVVRREGEGWYARVIFDV